ncbi:MAG: hypothetical protein H6751_03870 [Candidatus Omnitrophica bacterium]|nr:hypothetical protein [Candidatus Omnitrophota bacterium]
MRLIDWRLVEDFVFRNIFFFLIVVPVGFFAGFCDWQLYFLPFVLFVGVGTSIDEFFHMKPYRVIGSLGASEGSVIRTVWFENVLLPATFFALVYWIGALAGARGIQIGSEQFRTLLIAIFWILIFQSACLIFCLVIISEAD